MSDTVSFEKSEWHHYWVHRQHIGTPTGTGKLAWTWEWEVRRPWNHRDMQGDNWEKVGFKRFDSHSDAIRWAHREATKDRVRDAYVEFVEVDDNLETLADMVLGSLAYLAGLVL